MPSLVVGVGLGFLTAAYVGGFVNLKVLIDGMATDNGHSPLSVNNAGDSSLALFHLCNNHGLA